MWSTGGCVGASIAEERGMAGNFESVDEYISSFPVEV
jgi:hypothetical protein